MTAFTVVEPTSMPDRVDGRATSDLARLGQNPRRKRIGGRRRLHQGRKLNVNLGWGVVAAIRTGETVNPLVLPKNRTGQ